MLFLFLLTFSSVLSASLLSQDEPCESSTTYGKVHGEHMTSRINRKFCAFLGIPYATPPIKELRFLPPLPPKPWDGTRNATKEAEMCLQTGFIGSEDCLYLNIFTHSTNVSTLYAVLVYIHGGGFFMGSSSIGYHGPEYLMDKNIVLVTLQYRLGVFGFLSTGDKTISGNMGLKDQVKALEWVQDNIRSFGGDPAKVTIFGNSAGGASVHLHMQSPLSKNLFAKGISQSGTALSGFAIIGKDICRKTTTNIAVSLNCTIYDTLDILYCLQNKSSMAILQAYEQQLNSRYDFSRILFRPVVEDNINHAFLTVNPKKTITTKPWLVGVNGNEGIFRIKAKTLNETFSLIQSKFNSIASQLMLLEYVWSIPNEAINSIHEFYFKNISSTTDMIRSLEQIVTDSWFVWPTQQAIYNHKGLLYHYLYDHQSEHSFTEIYGSPKGFGVSHIDELICLFTQKDFFPPLNRQDTYISNLIVDLWVNFATEGNPTPQNISSNPQNKTTEDFTWSASENTNPIYLHIQTNKLVMNNKMFSNRMQFWQQLSLI